MARRWRRRPIDGTIRDNIAFSRPEATPEQVREVSRIAHCDEFIERFEKQYDTIVERGTHHQLMAVNGRYRQLHDRQYQLELDRFINPGEDFTLVPERAKAISEVEEARPPVA